MTNSMSAERVLALTTERHETLNAYRLAKVGSHHYFHLIKIPPGVVRT